MIKDESTDSGGIPAYFQRFGIELCREVPGWYTTTGLGHEITTDFMIRRTQVPYVKNRNSERDTHRWTAPHSTLFSFIYDRVS